MWFQTYLFVTDQKDNQLFVFDRQRRKHEVNFRVGAKPSDIKLYDSYAQESALCKGISIERNFCLLLKNKLECAHSSLKKN